VERKGLTHVAPSPAYAEVFPFDPGTVARLAYFFEYDYEAPRDPYEYSAGCAAAIDHWRDEVGHAALIRFDTGAALHIVDTRAMAVTRTAVLRGLERDVTLAAEHGAGIEEIARRTGAPPGAVREVVGRLLEHQHAVMLDDQVLSLAVPVDGWVPRGVPAVMVDDVLRDAYCQRMARLHQGYQERESEAAAAQAPASDPWTSS
jgi:hypothetical protein